MKITTFIGLTILIALVMTGFGLIISDANDKYDTGYAESDYESYKQLQELRNLSQQIRDETSGGNSTVDRSLADIFGNFLADAKNSLLISAKSYDMFETMADEGFNTIGIGNIFRLAFFALVIIIIFLSILGIIIGREV